MRYSDAARGLLRIVHRSDLKFHSSNLDYVGAMAMVYLRSCGIAQLGVVLAPCLVGRSDE